MAILEEIQKELMSALKSGDSVQSDVLRLLISALKDARIAKAEALTEDEELRVVFSESKKIKDSIEQYENAGRDDLAQREKTQLEYVEKYLPTQASEEEIEKAVDEAIKNLHATGMQDMGKVMGAVMPSLQGRADGGLINQIVSKKLSSKS